MSGFFARAADWAVKNRTRMPRWVGQVMESAARNPDGFVGRVSARLLGGGGTVATEVPDTDLRVYIAPTNYSGQGYLWARSLERSNPHIGARNAAVQLPGGYSFPADNVVSIATVNADAVWAEAEWEAARQFTHVLVEAERSMFGKRFNRNVEAEVLALEAEGVSVAFLCHGTDIRDPDRHAKLTPWSPYPEDPRTAVLREDAQRNSELLERMRRPTFVSTPDLLLDLPWAIWCPVVVDADRFEAHSLPFSGQLPRVIHASSNPLQKGSDHIEPALASLVESGELEYSLIPPTPSAQMPDVFAGADIVLDQFRLGSYGVAACEAMAAGRIVVGHVLPQVRERVKQDTGLRLPIIEATPDTLSQVIAGLIAEPRTAQAVAAEGPKFVATVHAGAASARVLTEQWIGD